jgi:hypothetical protein
MRTVRVSLFFLLAVALAIIGVAPGRMFAGRKAGASTRAASSHHRLLQAASAKAQAAKPRRVRIKSVQQQQGTGSPLLLVPAFTDDKQGLDGGGPPYLIPVLNTSTTTSVTITSVTPSAGLTISTNCGTLAPGASCTISMSFTTQTLCGLVSGTITVAGDPNVNPLTITVEGFGGDENFQIKNLTDATLSPANLAAQLVGTGVTISNVTYTGSPVAAGTFHTESSIIGFTDGIILSTGSARSVIGPNCSSSITTENGYPGDGDLSNLIGQNATFDAAILEFDFVPTNPTIRFQYVFASDEYEEFVFEFNDVFGFFVNGQNVALIPQTSTPVSINNINNGSTSVSGVPPVNPQFYINNDIQIFTPPLTPPVDTEMDGLTVVLSATANVNPGATNHIKLAIADALDNQVDSNVFIKAGSLSSSVVSLSPTGLAFGNLNAGGTSPTQTVTLTNVGTAVLTGVAVAPDSNNFTVSNNTCGTTVGAGAMCTFDVAFTPQAQQSGLIQGQIMVTDSAGDSPQPVTLSGTAVSGAFASISPLNLFFAPEATGVTSPPQTVTITNTGLVPLSFGSVSNTNTDFKLNSNCVSASIPVNGNCTITVTWTPSAGITIPETDAITLKNNAQNGGTQFVGLVGGVTSTISVAPAMLSFGNQTVNTTSAVQMVTITNTGSAVVTIPSIIAPAGFAETDNCVSSGGLVPTGQTGQNSCMISVTFMPTSIGAFSGALVITDSAQGSPHSVMLTGTGTAAGPTLKSITVTPNPATVAVGATIQFTATGHFSDGTTKDITTSSNWTSMNTEAATIGAMTGLATGVAVTEGSITITATAVGTEISGTAQLTVTNVPIQLTIPPPPGGTFGPVNPGGTLPVGVVLTANSGTTGTVTFSCTVTTPSGAPVNTITCKPVPSSVNLTANGPTQVALVVNTFCRGVGAAGIAIPSGPDGGLALLLLSSLLAGLVWAGRRNPRWAVSFALFLLIALGGVACNSVPKGANGATQPGDYQLVISATINGQTVSAPPITFHVN